ncbi:dynamin family protein [Bacillus sp. JCM 19041]|uniref:dynamin family protein n=1 Tax=Bacillus sp. JCM 19041 TaxID=1460637 RepID=UPI0006CFEDC2
MNGLKHGVEWTGQETIQWESIQQKRTFTLAFSGHFSSGKSTLLNELIGAPLLPTSPIPTSANQVYIGFGVLGVDVEKVNGEISRYVGEINWNDIRRYGMDGVGIRKLYIKAPIPFLQQSAELVDTPGVDSTDPTHQAMTMDALFTTDAVVYVMDYNHVKAETNLHFLKQLSDEAKPLFLVINQIDKHVEQELLFSTYKESIVQTLEAWGIKYISIYYTSMRTAEQNELSRLKTELIAVMTSGKMFAEFGKKRLERSFYLTQSRRIKENKEEAQADLTSTIKKLGFSIDDLNAYEKNLKELHDLEHASKNREKAFLADWNSLFRQATLFNSAITELTQEWLEAMRPNFRVGVLFSKRKTEEEKERRTKLLVAELQDQVQSQLVFHVQRSLQTVPVEFMDRKEAFLTALNQVTFEVSAAFLKNSMPKETVGREYVYQYAQNRSEEIKRIIKQRALDALNVAQESLKKEDQAHWIRAKKELDNQSKLAPYVDKWYQTTKEFKGQIDYLKKQAKACDDHGKLEYEIKAALQNATEQYEESNWLGNEEIEQPETVLDSELHQVQEKRVEQENLINIESLKETLEINKQKQWGKEWRERLEKRMKQMEMQRFTISLFGAFSAGKSSFANALIGADVLPTSPHPTTAAVTTVTAATEQSPHGTVVITYKSYQNLEEELTSISKLVSVKITPDNIRNIRISTIKADTAGKNKQLLFKNVARKLKKPRVVISNN